MKTKYPCFFLTALLLIASSQFIAASPWQEKPATKVPQAGPAKSGPDDARTPVTTGSRTASKADDTKPTKLKDDRITLGTDIVNVTISVTDPYPRFVTGLSKDRINRSIRALRRFIDTSHNDDDFFLIGFNDRAKLVQDFTTSGDNIVGHLMFVNPRGSTALYDAAYIAVEKEQQGRHSKKALLIISDGQDNNSRYTYKELRNRVKEADVQIYAIGITDPANDSLAGFGRSVLEEITRMTGGRAFFPNGYNEPELVEICTRIALELRHQYSIGFYPTDLQAEAKWHKVQVKVNPPRGLGRLSLTYRDGYQSFKK